MARHINYSFFEKIKRLLKKKLVVPMARLPHPPEEKSLGVAVGVFWAMTPLVGVQMWIVFMNWLLFTRIFKIYFSLTLGVIWTWVTNVFTMIPIYYVFYLTGQLLRGDFSNSDGYEGLSIALHEIVKGDLDFKEKWFLFLDIMVNDIGISMAIGCLPWAIISSIVAYKVTLKYENYRYSKKKKKRS